MNRVSVGIDLTWVRHKIVGGTESYVTNLLDGFASVNDEKIRYVLVTTRDNYEVFKRFENYESFSIYTANILSANVKQRVIWQNLSLVRTLRKLNIGICIEPVYLKPFTCNKGVKFITTIHDLQAAHYPEYFSRLRVIWMKMAWKHSTRSSANIIVTSRYAKNDIITRYNVDENKIVSAPDPVTIDKNDCVDERYLESRGIVKDNYYYMVTSLLPHKNIDTVVKCLGILYQKNSHAFAPLWISGVGGKSKDEIEYLAEKNGIAEYVHLTGFVTDSERNRLYKDCKAFLAPSLFEGFGMPPIEAMIMGAPVVTTMETCSHEVTGGLATYVKEAKNAHEWCDKLEKGVMAAYSSDVEKLVEGYSKESVAKIFNKLVLERAEE